jgi:hypothetical protein
MSFTSIHFLLFFPIVTALYFGLPLRLRWLLLLAGVRALISPVGAKKSCCYDDPLILNLWSVWVYIPGLTVTGDSATPLRRDGEIADAAPGREHMPQ